MSAYLVANYTITNPDGYAAYPAAVAPTLEPFGGELVVADFDSESIEGEPLPVTIIVKFPSKDAARAWHGSTAYQAVISLRTDNTEGFVVFVDGVTGR
jgi:uncharacterized protein (DUF1330 family)